MKRREFITKGVAVGAMALGAGTLLGACSRNLRMEKMHTRVMTDPIRYLTPDAYQILEYASLAPSGHNSQPWAVTLLNETEWLIASDKKRWLPSVDAMNREVMLSLGAFIENLVIAASAFGFRAHVDILAATSFDRDVAKVTLERKSPQQVSLKLISLRRTVKSNMLSKELVPSDVKVLEEQAGEMLHYFPRGSRHAAFMEKEAIDNFKIQTENDKAQQELAGWIRFGNKDIRKNMDGITTQSMEIGGIAGWVVRNFMTPDDVMGRSFRQKGIEKTIEQAKQGAGWIVITSKTNSVADQIDAGRRFQRMALTAREKNIAIHPMTQALEEKHGQSNIRKNHPPGMIPQFMLRVGYIDHYPDPVSLRRPVQWFVTAG